MLPRDGPPAALCRVMKKIREAGFAVYIVGGAVRDAILYGTWQVVGDWDLATAARPEQVEALFPVTIPLGKEHGTVKVLSEEIEAEVTTFRLENSYRDHRRPDEVTFTSQIQEDLKRRDFTICAMAYDPMDQVFVDPYGGREDLARKLVRAVGQPEVRLAEDHLRMLRAVRFASTLGFQLEAKLALAIQKQSYRIRTLAWERIAMELVKILRGPAGGRGFRLLGELGLFQEILPELEDNLDLNLRIMDQTPPVLHLRLAALLGNVTTQGSQEILQRLRLPRTLEKKVLVLHTWQNVDPVGWTELDLRQFLAQAGPLALDLVVLWRARARAQGEDCSQLEAQLMHIVELQQENLPLTISDLAMDGRGVMELLAIEPGPLVGEILEKLLARVIENPELNNAADLQQLVLNERSSRMAEVRPMRALRYNTNKIEMEKVVAPPYDVISPEQQEEYYKASPYNIIRLELGKGETGDNETNNRYTRAKAALDAWQKEEVLSLDTKPSFYIYEQEFQVEGKTYQRRGIFARLKLVDFSEGIVLPHEETLSGPKADRNQLLEATRTNLSPIFGLFADEKRQIGSIMDQVCQGKPDLDFKGFDQIGERLWRVSDQDLCQEISALFAPEKIYIADGHHRYETALAFSKRHPEADAIMIVLVPLNNPGLVCLPTHRMLIDVDLSGLLEKLQPKFEIQSFAPEKEAQETIVKALEERKHAFGLILPDGYHLLTLKEEAALKPEKLGHSPAYCQLDVTILHKLILEDELGIGKEELRAQSKVRYTRSSQEAILAVKNGEVLASFLMGSVDVNEVKLVAEAGEKMPQKSTYFYPKLITGLVLNPLDEQNR